MHGIHDFNYELSFYKFNRSFSGNNGDAREEWKVDSARTVLPAVPISANLKGLIAAPLGSAPLQPVPGTTGYNVGGNNRIDKRAIVRVDKDSRKVIRPLAFFETSTAPDGTVTYTKGRVSVYQDLAINRINRNSYFTVPKRCQNIK